MKRVGRPAPGYASVAMSTEPADTTTLLAGRYQLEDVIARGGMGTVWRGTDSRLRRPVAIKEVVVTGAGDDAQRRAARVRCLREAHAAARVNHPSVVAVYDVVEENDRLYLVMELVDAPTLTEVVAAHGPLAPPAAAELGLRLADALHAAHTEGIVHRDLKPSNVLIPGQRRLAKLADFGIAATIHDPRITASGLIIGSPSFMAPEQAQGLPASPATDLWGLGTTLYFAVEGVSPFARDSTMATVHAVVHEPPRPPERAGPLSPLIVALLAKEPGNRLPLAEVRTQLADVREGRTETEGAVDATVAVPVADDPAGTAVLPSAAVAAAGSPAAPPAVRPPHVSERRSHVGRRRLAVALVAVAVVVVVALAAWAVEAGRDGGPGLANAVSTSTPSTAAAVEWTDYADPSTGFTISYPAGWEVSRHSTRTDFTDPETGALVRVDWTDEPGDDPVAAWESLARSFAKDHGGYEQIRIEPIAFHGLDAAVWEFTFDDGDGVRHALDIGMVTGSYGFALFFQAPAGEWDALQPIFQQFQDSFVPPSDPASTTTAPKRGDKGKGHGND